MAKKIPFSEALRRAISQSELTRYQIFKRTGIDQSTLSKFVHGQVGLSIESIDLLYECLGLKVTTPKQRKKKGK